jgi:hypothetical protein
MNKIIGAAFGVALLAMAAVPAMANSVTIGTTGPWSLNTVLFNQNTRVKVKTNQFAMVDNSVNNTANSGGDSVIGNTQAEGGAGSGNATANTTVDNQLNGSQVVVNTPCDCQKNTDITMTETGPGSINNIEVNNNTSIRVNTNQGAFVRNNISSTANSGGNTVSFNTQGGGISSGNASAFGGVTNWLNTSSTYINATPSTP